MNTVNVKIAIMSHLSEAQYLMRTNKFDEADLHTNYAKLLLMKYENTDVYVSEEKLEELWATLEDGMKKK